MKYNCNFLCPFYYFNLGITLRTTKSDTEPETRTSGGSPSSGVARRLLARDNRGLSSSNNTRRLFVEAQKNWRWQLVEEQNKQISLCFRR